MNAKNTPEMIARFEQTSAAAQKAGEIARAAYIEAMRAHSHAAELLNRADAAWIRARRSASPEDRAIVLQIYEEQRIASDAAEAMRVEAGRLADLASSASNRVELLYA